MAFTGGSFFVSDFDPVIAAQDNFAPDRIRDLRLAVAVYGSNNITLEWTAPGDDLYTGTGMFCYSYTFLFI